MTPKSLPTNNIFSNKPSAVGEIVSNKQSIQPLANQQKETILSSKREEPIKQETVNNTFPKKLESVFTSQKKEETII